MESHDVLLDVVSQCSSDLPCPCIRCKGASANTAGGGWEYVAVLWLLLVMVVCWRRASVGEGGAASCACVGELSVLSSYGACLATRFVCPKPGAEVEHRA